MAFSSLLADVARVFEAIGATVLVVGLRGDVRILNPAGLRVLNRPESLRPEAFQRAPREEPLNSLR